MKSLSGAFNKNNNDNKSKEISALFTKNVESEETVPRKIFESDYEFIRNYAFRKNIKMLEATEIIHKKIRDEVESKSPSIINIDGDLLDGAKEKSMRLSVEFINYLKYLSNETRIPMKFIISFFVQYFKEELEKEIKG